MNKYRLTMEEEEIKNTSWRGEKGSRAQMEELVLRRRRSLLPLKSGGKNRMGICTDKCVGRQQNLRDLFHGWEPQFSLGRDRSKEGDWELGGGLGVGVGRWMPAIAVRETARGSCLRTCTKTSSRVSPQMRLDSRNLYRRWYFCSEIFWTCLVQIGL